MKRVVAISIMMLAAFAASPVMATETTIVNGDGTVTPTNGTTAVNSTNGDANANGAVISGNGTDQKSTGSVGQNNPAANTPASTTLAPTIISGRFTYPPGMSYKDANGQTKICKGNYTIDTNAHPALTNCPDTVSEETTSAKDAPTTPKATVVPAAKASSSNHLSSDSSSSLRSDKVSLH